MSTQATYFIMLPSGYMVASTHVNVRNAVNEMQSNGGVALLDRGDLENMRKQLDYLLGYVLPEKDSAS